MSGGTVFLTGGTGFIGSRVATLFSERGHALRCLVRSGSDVARLEALGADLITGDVTRPETMAEGVEGADVAVHLAAIYRFGRLDRGRMQAVNVAGTKNFLTAVHQAQTPRPVYVSTTLALGPAPPGSPRGDENSTHPGSYASEYERTKTTAHHAATEAQREGVPLIIVCPAFVYGPGDTGPVGSSLEDLLRGRLPALATRMVHFSFVHVDDVAEGIVRAATRGRPGETYVLSGDERPMDEFLELAAALAGRRAPRLRVPPFVVRLTGRLMDAASALTGVRLPVSHENAATTTGERRLLHSHEKATRELDWRPRGLEEGLPGAVRDVASRISPS